MPASEPDRMNWQAAFDLLFETTSTAVAILDERRCLVDLNPAAQRLLGQCTADATAAEVEAAVADDGARPIRRRVGAVAARGTRVGDADPDRP